LTRVSRSGKHLWLRRLPRATSREDWSLEEADKPVPRRLPAVLGQEDSR
jgi:hypothetical protein